MFTKLGLPNQLKNPLVPWTPQAALICTWHTTFNVNTYNHYQHLPDQPAQKHIPYQTTRYHHFYQQPEPTIHKPTNMPVTTEHQ